MNYNGLKKIIFCFVIFLLISTNCSSIIKPFKIREEQFQKSIKPPINTLDSAPLEDSSVRGYIKDITNAEPVMNANIQLYWKDYMGNSDFFYIQTDQNGYYEMNVPAGQFRLYIRADGYFDEHTNSYTLFEYDIFWINVSLYQLPNDNAIVDGYVKDIITNMEISNAEIGLWWEDDFGHILYNRTCSNENGFYEINLPEGEFFLDVSADGYFSNFSASKEIKENEIVWINFTLYSVPSENAFIGGYITDEKTNLPISNAQISLDWYDDFRHNLHNLTYSNENGYYEMNVLEGEFYLAVIADGYFSKFSANNEINENETLCINFSLYPKPQDSAIIQGYLKDKDTNMPIEGGHVDVSWYDDFGHYFSKDTYSNQNGYYYFSMPSSKFDLFISAEDYLDENLDNYVIKENETLWINVSLLPIPLENSLINGYVTDSETKIKIPNVEISLNWYDDYGHDYCNYTCSNQNGYYEMNAPAGEFFLYIFADGYFDGFIGYYEINENEMLWVNISLYSEPKDSAIIQGYIIDKNTNLCLPDAEIRLQWGAILTINIITIIQTQIRMGTMI